MTSSGVSAYLSQLLHIVIPLLLFTKMENCQDKFTFVVGDECIEVEKQKLARKIQYFETLFAGNYADSSLTEYKTSLNWTARSIKDLIEWIYDEGEGLNPKTKFLKKSLWKFESDAADQLIDLFDIANYFLVDELQNDLKKVILRRTLASQNAISFYVYAKNQPFMKDVQDSAFALCIEQFSKLPLEQFPILSLDILLKIVGNSNLQFEDEKHLKNVMETWHKFNCGKIDVSQENFAKLVTSVVEKRVLEDIQCCIYHKLEESNKKVVVVVWDGSDLSDFVLEFPFESNPKEMLVGAQMIARGFDIYLVGGKFGLGNGPFNNDIWRFSTLTKQWYYVTSLKEPLRHMSAIFWESRLYVIGGIGRFRIKNDTMRYFDLDSEEWSAPIPLIKNLVQDPCTCILDNKIVVAGPSFYKFDPQTAEWEQLRFNEDFEKSAIEGLKSISSHLQYIFCAVQHNDNSTTIYAVDTQTGKVQSTKFDVQIPVITTCGFEVVGFHSECSRVKVMGCHFVEYESGDYFLKYVDHVLRNNPPFGCFNIKNPRDLYSQVSSLSSFNKSES